VPESAPWSAAQRPLPPEPGAPPRSLPDAPVFPVVDLHRRGWTPGAIAHAVRTGGLLDLHQGWYGHPDRIPEDPASHHVASVGARQRAVAERLVGSHESAAMAHGLWLLDDHTGDPVLSRVRERGERRPAAQDSGPLVAQFPDHHVVTVHGVELASPARTVVDLARRGDPLAGVVAVDSALRQGVPRAELEEVLVFCAGWPGIRLAREVVAFGDKRSESVIESMGRWRFHEGGLDAPELQVWYGVHQPTDRVDFAWPARRTIGEADGLVKYAGSAGVDNLSLVREKKRDLRIERDYDCALFHFDYAEARYRGPQLVERARHALALGDARAEARRRRAP
jgi:hypothetical protein